MFVSLNGELVPEEKAVVSIFDRSFRYGDGLFEAVLVRRGKLFRWPQHVQRLENSAKFLKIVLPCSVESLLKDAQQLIAVNESKDAVLRIQLSRGAGPRGYAPSGEEKPLIVMSLHPALARESLGGLRWKLTLCSLRIAANDPLAHHKTSSRLIQVLAATEARERGADESLLLNTNGEVTEGSTSNVFWIERGTVCTPPLSVGALPGVTRAVVLELCDALSLPRRERTIRPDELSSCEGVFLSFTSRGIVEAASIDGEALRPSPISERLREEFEALLDRECSGSS
jgi:branched-chain amino acid aminotransferase